MKLCKDCKHFNKGYFIGGFYIEPKCSQPELIDQVNGAPTSCGINRIIKCGDNAIYFEQRPPEPIVIKKSFLERLFG